MHAAQVSSLTPEQCGNLNDTPRALRGACHIVSGVGGQSIRATESANGYALPIMAWIWLFLAGVFEIMWAVGLKESAGLTRVWPTIFTIVALIVSMALLAMAVRTLPIGTAYAMWTGIGAVGTATLGIVLYDEPRDAARLVCLAMIVAGIVGLKLVTRP